MTASDADHPTQGRVMVSRPDAGAVRNGRRGRHLLHHRRLEALSPSQGRLSTATDQPMVADVARSPGKATAHWLRGVPLISRPVRVPL
jgi:hypothetical protein